MQHRAFADESRNPGVAGGNADGNALISLVMPEPGIALLTLTRPSARNALSLALLRALEAHIIGLAADSSVAAIVLAGAGPVFCSGHDLKELTAHRGDGDGGRAFFTETMSTCARVMEGIVGCRVPVVAAVQGAATAAGCQLVATCDLAVAAERATFATPGVNIGLFCSTPMVALSRNVPAKRAMEMLLLGDNIPADAAARYGLVNRVVPDDQVLPEAIALARRIAQKSKSVVGLGKEAFYRQADMTLAEAYAFATKVMVETMLASDACEGIAAFLEKRPPSWTDG